MKKIFLALFALTTLLTLSACQREAKAPPGSVKIDSDGGAEIERALPAQR